MPILRLTEKELPRLLEFYDYRARQGGGLLLLSQADGTRAALEALPAAAFAEGAVLGVNSSSVGLIRGVVQFRPSHSSSADVVFVMDKSIDNLALTSEMLTRLIEIARSSGVSSLSIVAEESSTLLSALRSSGWPMQDEVPNQWVLNIAGVELRRQQRSPAVGAAPQQGQGSPGGARMTATT